MKKLLITFGCSWTYGVGANYEPGMTLKDFKEKAWDLDICSQYSFRGILSENHGYDNINFSMGGSSNQAQFRLAEYFFSSELFNDYQKKYKKIIVLWGITSVLRNEFYCRGAQDLRNVFYTSPEQISKCILADHFDMDHEIYLIRKKIEFWDSIFDRLQIEHRWFDTFNHHDYNHIPRYQYFKDLYNNVAGPDWPSWDKFLSRDFGDADETIKHEILNPHHWGFYKIFRKPLINLIGYNESSRDLLSKLAIKNGIQTLDSKYHLSDWNIDNSQIKFLVEEGFLNPYSNHPTKQAHQQIADLMLPYLQNIL